ncbi:hypothetical protein AB0I10_00290 [Streptomyces sp. NPDC050636]|uniref:hypothetical protein n=1 Tax=Streptomyces sp. NPDC050636 TaxID=3154510 RepID=UPI00343E8A6D
MTQNQIYITVAITAIVVFMLVRSGEVRWWQAFSASLLGFCLALTPVGSMVIWAFSLFMGIFG